jgi:hypothetical protein
MNVAKSRLKPVRLAIPTLLAVSATAAWSPTVSWAGTGFSATADTSTPKITAKYLNPGHSLTLYASTHRRVTGAWIDVTNDPVVTDNAEVFQSGFTNPPTTFASAILQVQNGLWNNNYAYAAVQ